ncbi:hypothetical protein G443_001832 [Actinoalloteichus cyanogriseus DSM 43889]|uniref:Uncharacterized protein n=1 Tax=Actinoalloteichus caeruleus DSM 43889 TaxID=1120930 RepID=A0ABT1JGD4_ACTCY|nr:hypothetical protein [Actinoalloteichus caeruleus DSM 43889]
MSGSSAGARRGWVGAADGGRVPGGRRSVVPERAPAVGTWAGAAGTRPPRPVQAPEFAVAQTWDRCQRPAASAARRNSEWGSCRLPMATASRRNRAASSQSKAMRTFRLTLGILARW